MARPVEPRSVSQVMACSEPITHRAYDFLQSPGSVVTILIGENEEPFVVHEHILKAESEYFRTALSGPWKEAEQRSFRFEDVRPAEFAVYVRWLYYSNVQVPDLASTLPAALSASKYVDSCLASIASDYPEPSDQSDGDRKYWSISPSDRAWTYLFLLYALGDRLQSVAFKNGVMDYILSRLDTVHTWITSTATDRQNFEIPLCLAIRYSYENTPPKSALRKFITNTTAELGCFDFLISQFSSAQHPDFIIDLGRKLASNGNVVNGTARRHADWSVATHREPRNELCALYHEHPKPELVSREPNIVASSSMVRQ